ncbi:metal ABC transporter permease [Rubrivirga sp. IMCC45206]|uniref:metal ABC transporter permease n=1 Tax=Rubrivirga sp. IMCC45206 TaxID=3391614 RepID=UPI00398FA57A
MIDLDYTLRTVALGAAVLGLSSGSLGAFAVLRGQSLLGDAISHAALPGVALAFILTASKAPLVLVLGAGLAGWIGTLCVMAVVERSRVPYDAALGIVLSVFFGLGMVLLTYIQSRPDASQAGLDTFLFGQAAALVGRDVVTMAALGLVALLAMVVFWKEFKLLLFDPDFAASQGFSVRALDIGLTTLLVVAIVIGLQTVGVVLMSALIVAPAAAARQWTDRLWGVVALAGVFGAVSGAGGALLSGATARIPTGPTIVLVASVIVAASLVFAPGRGLLSGVIRSRRNRRVLRVAGTLEDLYTLALAHADPHYPHPAATLKTMTSRPEAVDPTLARLQTHGFVAPTGDAWALTERGLAEARRLARERTD